MLIRFCQIISKISYKLNLGNGSTWPGHIALNLNPKILKSLESKLSNGSIVIVGTNGKTTTAKLIREVLQKNYKVVHNDSGANLLNGVASSLIKSDSSKKSDYGVFEVDENTLPHLIESFTPKIVVVLNLFRDQLDRYGEVDAISQKWKKALEKLPKTTTVILNADDPQVAYLGLNLKAKVVYLGLENKSLFLTQPEHATDSTYCPLCGEKLFYSGIYYSHLGIWRCNKCKFKRPIVRTLKVRTSLAGVYNLYNTLAAEITLNELGIVDEEIQKIISEFKPAFGRQEEIEFKGVMIRILLSKNPTGFNQSIRTLDSFSKNKKTILLVLNDRIPDGKDISWIWDVDYENLKQKAKKIYISGDRCFDMALRIKYADVSNFEVIKNLEDCLNSAIENLEKSEVLYVLPTYSAMLDFRKIISGKKIL